jgi:hypothetical protein
MTPTQGRADERGYGTGRYPGEIAQQGAMVEEVGSPRAIIRTSGRRDDVARARPAGERIVWRCSSLAGS